MMILKLISTVVVAIALSLCAAAFGQSSSLYTAQPQAPVVENGFKVNPALQQASYTVVTTPEPRRFAMHDLITIVIREQSSAVSESTLETNKETKVDGQVSAFPHLTLKDLLDGQVRAGRTEDLPKVGVDFKNEFEGDGEYERKDSLTTRLTGRVVDVKPNGTLSVEARTFIQNDDEKLEILVTGYCRPDDVTPDNSVLSTQIYDLRVTKVHSGELRKTSKKGLFTKILDTVFNF